MSRDPVIGIFLQTVFPVPGWYLRDMGLAGWKSHLDWAKSLGFNACMFSSHVQFRLDQPECSLPEARRLYHGLLAPRPAFGPGEVYYEKDPELSTPEVRRIVDTRIDAMRSQIITMQPRITPVRCRVATLVCWITAMHPLIARFAYLGHSNALPGHKKSIPRSPERATG